jgi:hypothetical protein
MIGVRGEEGQGNTMGRIGGRPFWVLGLSIFTRAIHLVGAGVVLTFFLLFEGEGAKAPFAYTLLTVGSGLLLLFTEWLRHRQIWREFAGVATFVKVILLGAIFHGLLPGRETMLLVFVLASVAAHAPKLVRHRLLF